MTDKKATVLEAIQKLDPALNEHWTADDLPRVEVVSEIAGVDVSRQEITEAAPDFVRPDSDPLPPPPPAEPKQTTEEQFREERLRQIAELDAEIGELDNERREIQSQIDKLVRERDSIETERQKAEGPHAETKARVQYIASQNAARARRGRSVMDAAFARQNGRGTQRPNVTKKE